MRLNRRHFPTSRFDLFSDFDRLFDHALGRPPTPPRHEALAGFDVLEDDEAWVLRTDLPGFEKGDVKVSVDDGVVTLHARRDGDDRRFYAERKRAFRLPGNTDATAIEARLEHGVLELAIPKIKEPDTSTLRIEVK